MRYAPMLLTVVAGLSLAPSATAQVQWRPTPPPEVSAVDRDWYARRLPVRFAGDLYYPTKRLVFFNGYSMVESGEYDGVPLYTDTTITPFREVLVPVGRGLMESYERPPIGELEGTTGSRASAIPADPSGTRPGRGWTNDPALYGAGDAWPAQPTGDDAVESQAQEMASAPRPCRLEQAGVVATVRAPEGNIGIWITFRGRRWASAGAAVPLEGSGLSRIDDYRGFPVYARSTDGGDSRERIYLPTRAGLVAPYEPVS